MLEPLVVIIIIIMHTIPAAVPRMLGILWCPTEVLNLWNHISQISANKLKRQALPPNLISLSQILLNQPWLMQEPMIMYVVYIVCTMCLQMPPALMQGPADGLCRIGTLEEVSLVRILYATGQLQKGCMSECTANDKQNLLSGLQASSSLT